MPVHRRECECVVCVCLCVACEGGARGRDTLKKKRLVHPFLMLIFASSSSHHGPWFRLGGEAHHGPGKQRSADTRLGLMSHNPFCVPNRPLFPLRLHHPILDFFFYGVKIFRARRVMRHQHALSPNLNQKAVIDVKTKICANCPHLAWSCYTPHPIYILRVRITARETTARQCTI
ncbi:hypothetical protein BC940DRAFT_73878 [Gongronella butleri]|nr:hypothetical protein BC940DRAFT_73878 [Gongronella butleri]